MDEFADLKECPSEDKKVQEILSKYRLVYTKPEGSEGLESHISIEQNPRNPILRLLVTVGHFIGRLVGAYESKSLDREAAIVLKEALRQDKTPDATTKREILLKLIPDKFKESVFLPQMRALGAKDLSALIQMADELNPKANYLLGMMYQTPNSGVPIDAKKAFECFEKAAEKDHPQAIYELGSLYMKGSGVEKNPQKAIELFEKIPNDPNAALHLGTLHLSEKPSPQNVLQGVTSLAKSYHALLPGQNQKVAESLYDIACLYEEGVDEFSKNPLAAIALYQMAAQLGSKEAEDKLKVLVDSPEGFMKHLRVFTGDNFLDTLKKAASGDAWALYWIGNMYKGTITGSEWMQDKEVFLSYMLQAAEKGEPFAMRAAAEALQKGTGTARNAEEAFKWYEKAAEKAPDAYENLGQLCVTGDGVPKDIAKGVDYFFQYATKRFPGHPPGDILYDIAEKNFKANHVDVALALYEKAAELGNAEAKKVMDSVNKPD
jgi:TPR repeat protein